MSETIDPPIPLPPANEPPAGLPYLPPPQPEKTLAQVGAIITIISGAVTVLAVFLPSFSLFDGVNYQYWSLSTAPDAAFFMPMGLVVAVLGVVRLHSDHVAIKVITVLLGLYAVKTAIADANAVHNIFVTQYSNSGLTFTYGPALFMIGIASVVAIVGACLSNPLNRH